MVSVSVFGLGKVGHTLASCLGVAGHRVISYDINPDAVNAINARTLVTSENGVCERLAQLAPDQLRATLSAEEAVLESDVTFVIVPTPSNSLGGFSLRYILTACKAIGEAMRKKQGNHVISIVSTVMPGASDRFILPLLESASGRKLGHGLGYCYNPAFIALGEVVKGFEVPDYVLIGEADVQSGEIIAAIHKQMVRNDAPVVRMKAAEAEITKIASNTHETMRVSFANMLFSLCTEVPGADVDRVTGALAYRMGKRFFKGAVPYGGPCWPRDNRALAAFIDAVGGTSVMPRAIDDFNNEHAHYVLRKLLNLSKVGDTIGLIGLAYKPGTPVIERSFSIDLAGWLVTEGRKVVGWDPLAMDEARGALGNSIEFANSPEQLLAASDVSVVAIPLSELAAIDWKAAGDSLVVDCWRCLSPDALSKIRNFRALGRGEENLDLGSWIKENLGNRFDVLCN